MRIRGLSQSLCAFFAVVLVATAAGASNDAAFEKQWGLAKIGAPEAWAHSTGAGVRVGIVDTGVDLNHEDLAGRVVEHTSCVGSGGDPAKCKGSAQDDQGHGTHVAGIVAANRDNGVGIAGVAPDAELVVVKALNAAGSGTVADINAGIKWVVDHGARVVNLSLGDPNFIVTSLLGTDMREGIEYAWSKGAVPVVASGNSNLLGLGLGSSNYGSLNALVVGATGRAPPAHRRRQGVVRQLQGPSRRRPGQRPAVAPSSSVVAPPPPLAPGAAPSGRTGNPPPLGAARPRPGPGRNRRSGRFAVSRR